MVDKKLVLDRLREAANIVYDTKHQRMNMLDDDDALQVRYALLDAVSLLEKEKET